MIEDQRAGETAAINASPLDPNVEYIPAGMANRNACHCPRTVLDDGPRSWRLKVLHVGACTSRVSEASPVTERLPEGVHPCPTCGNVTFAMLPAERQLPGWRRCHGPAGCEHEFHPTTPAVTRRQTLSERLADSRRAA